MSEKRTISHNVRFNKTEYKRVTLHAKEQGFDNVVTYLRHAMLEFPKANSQNVARLQVITREQNRLDLFQEAAARALEELGAEAKFGRTDDAILFCINKAVFLQEMVDMLEENLNGANDKLQLASKENDDANKQIQELIETNGLANLSKRDYDLAIEQKKRADEDFARVERQRCDLKEVTDKIALRLNCYSASEPILVNIDQILADRAELRAKLADLRVENQKLASRLDLLGDLLSKNIFAMIWMRITGLFKRQKYKEFE